MPIIKTLLTALIFLSASFPVLAEEEKYYVFDYQSEEKETFASFDTAYRYYNNNKDAYDNLLLYHNDKLLLMEYGIVEFKSDSACSIVNKYHSSSRDEDDYLNACYGADAAYLNTSKNGKTVSFMLSGDIGDTDIDNVTLHPIESLNVKTSNYNVIDGNLIHNIKNQLNNDYFAYSFSMDEALDCLKQGIDYYSYDGHFFYEDFYQMIDDYRSGNNDNAVNSQKYFNYFQFLPHRSLSNYHSAELNDYFYNTLGINGSLSHYIDLNADYANDEVNRSQLYENIDSFLTYQNLYGANALLMISAAISESSYGKSENAFVNNNLYSTVAFDSEDEKQANRYSAVSDSIKAHGKYFISSLYSNHLRSDYYGTCLGNKLCGISVNYSLDPYYGDRIAANAYELDCKLGGKDYNSYAIGIIENAQRLTFYADENRNKIKFILNDVEQLSFVILKEYSDVYKIQIDNSYSDEYIYDFENSVAYVLKNAFAYILNEDKIKDYELHDVEYDFNQGTFNDKNKLTVKLRDNEELNIKPELKGYEFLGFQEDNGKYIAQYKQIKEISIATPFNQTVELYQNINLESGELLVKYVDGNKKIIPINSDMISFFDNTIPGKQNISINYCGLSLNEEIEVSQDLYQKRQTISEALKEKNYLDLKDNLDDIAYPFSFSQIREINTALSRLHKRNYVIKDDTNKYNLSISGLDLSLENKNSFELIDDTYYAYISSIKPSVKERIVDFAKGYGFKEVEGIDISFRFNYSNIDLIGPIIVQLNLDNKQNDLVYSVYHLNKKGDIIKCRTTQSENFIQFMINESGSYLILSMPSVNEYLIEDSIEDLSYNNMGFDINAFIIKLLLALLFTLLCLINFTIYYVLISRKEKQWNDYKKSLLNVESVQEEKLRS